MHPNAELIERFYTSFQRRDAEGMIACYDSEVAFSDPVFTQLKGARACAMWRMLTTRAKSLEITFDRVHADDETGGAHWEARYIFSATGRPVHNVIDAAFRFRDGKIVRHDDTFDLWRWARMALGPKGVLLGWLPPVQRAIRANAAKGLDAFLADNAAK
jgi:ketosteroid isomerase-like protein